MKELEGEKEKASSSIWVAAGFPRSPAVVYDFWSTTWSTMLLKICHTGLQSPQRDYVKNVNAELFPVKKRVKSVSLRF